MIRKLRTKDYTNFLDFCTLKDKYLDFYIFENNSRFLLSDLNIAKKQFKNCLQRSDKAFVVEDNDIIKGILFIHGYSNKSEKKYIKVLGIKHEIVEDLFRILIWNCKDEVYIRIKRNNPILNLLNNRQFTYKENKGFGFQFLRVHKDEIEFKYIPSKKDFGIPAFFKKEEDE